MFQLRALCNRTYIVQKLFYVELSSRERTMTRMVSNLVLAFNMDGCQLCSRLHWSLQKDQCDIISATYRLTNKVSCIMCLWSIVCVRCHKLSRVVPNPVVYCICSTWSKHIRLVFVQGVLSEAVKNGIIYVCKLLIMCSLYGVTFYVCARCICFCRMCIMKHNEWKRSFIHCRYNPNSMFALWNIITETS